MSCKLLMEMFKKCKKISVKVKINNTFFFFYNSYMIKNIIINFFLKVCNIVKPERSHHCSKCDSCVLNMDHHCVWLASCVGFYNRKAFILILFYGSFTLFLGILFAFSRYIVVYEQIKVKNN